MRYVENYLSRGILLLGIAIALAGTLILVFADHYNYLLPFYLGLGNLALGFYVYLSNRRSKINISFFLTLVVIVFWSLAIFFYSITESIAGALFWSRIAALIAVYIPPFFLFFVNIFPKEEKPLKFSQMFFWIALATLLAGLSLTNLIVKDITMVEMRFEWTPGPALLFYALYFAVVFGLAFYKLVSKYYRCTGVDKLQIAYVFLGFFIGSAFSITTNIILPFFGWSGLAGVGPYSTIILVAFISYAIVKHRLMSIEIVIQRSAVYGIVTVLVMALYAMAVMISETYLRKVIGYTSLFVTALAALGIAVIYQPLVRSFQNLTDRLFFRGRYDYQKTLREISQKIASVIRLDELSRLIVSSFVDTMKVSEISFLLSGKEKEHFYSVPLSLPRYKRIEIDIGSPIISWLSAAKEILFLEEIEDEIDRQAAPGKEGEIKRGSLEEVRDEIERLGISIWVPIVSKEELIGIIALGNKLSGDVFTTEDIGLLSTLASQTAVALDNARLYNEVVNMRDYSEKILQSMVSGVLTVDTRGKIVTFNYMAEKITGRKTGEALGRTSEEIWGKKGMIPNIVENTLNKGKAYVNFESNIASPEKGLVPVSFSSTVLVDHEGKKIGALLTIQDLTEVKELEGKVRQADKLSALATMAAGMAHEIKNPLSSMKVLSQLIPKKIGDPEFRNKLQEIIPREINRIDRIVESLLGFARATALNFEKTNIKDILEENLKYFEDQVKSSEVKIIRNYSQLPEIEVDRGQISQVFSNLILNAIQAMRGGGELRVATMPGKEIEGMPRNVKIRISDTGHGISEDKLKRLFDPFFTTKYGGTGLGLTISHSIVDGHKGYIDVESKVGKGTTFMVALPVSQGLL